MVSQDQENSLWTIVSNGSHLQATPGKLKFHGLKPETTYEVSCLNDNLAYLAHFGKALPTWLNDKTCKLSGELLMQLGLLLPYMTPQTALLLSCNAKNIETI